MSLITGPFVYAPTTVVPPASSSSSNNAGGSSTIDVSEFELPFLYGEREVPLRYIPLSNSGDDLYGILVATEGPVNLFKNIKLGNGNLYVDGVGIINSNIVGGLTLKYGTSNQTASSLLTDRLPGTAYAAITLKMHNMAAVGSPDFTAVMQGFKLYDPRLDTTNGGSGSHRLADITTWTYSNNPALCLAHYLMSKRVGPGISSALIDWASVAAAADYCDGLVGAEKRYEFNYLFTGGMSVQDVIDRILIHFLGHLSYDGMFHFEYAYPKSLVGLTTFTDQEPDRIWNTSFSRPQRQDRYKKVVGTWTNPTTWEQVPYQLEAPDVAGMQNAAAQQSYDLSGFTKISQCHRVVLFLLNSRLADLDVQFQTANDKGILPGGLCKVTDDIGLSEKLIECVTVEPQSDGSTVIAGREYDPAVFSDAIITEPTFPDTDLPDPSAAPEDVTGLTGSDAYRVEGGAGILSGSFSWDPSADPFFDHYEISIGAAEGGPYVVQPGEVWDASYLIDNLDIGVAYWLKVVTVNIWGVKSTGVTASITAGASLPEVPVVTGLAGVDASEIAGEITVLKGNFTWGEAATPIIDHYEVWIANNAAPPAWPEGYTVFTVKSDSTAETARYDVNSGTGLTWGVLCWARVIAVDKWGRKGAACTAVSFVGGESLLVPPRVENVALTQEAVDVFPYDNSLTTARLTATWDAATDPIVKSYDVYSCVKKISMWSAPVDVVVGQLVYNSLYYYVCIQAGTTAPGPGPLGDGSDITDGTAHWKNVNYLPSAEVMPLFPSEFDFEGNTTGTSKVLAIAMANVGPILVTARHLLFLRVVARSVSGGKSNPGPFPAPAWTSLTSYAVGQIVARGYYTYECITAGVSGSGSWTGTSSDYTDGTAHWKYVDWYLVNPATVIYTRGGIVPLGEADATPLSVDDINALLAAEDALELSGSYSVGTDLTIPAELYVRVAPGTTITIASGKTLTINGPFEAGPFQIFYGSGTVVFASGTPSPIWSGTGSYGGPVLVYQTHDHTSGNGAAITEAAITLSDSTTGNVSTAKHGFCPKLPNDAAKVLDGTGAWSTITEADLTLADNTTANVSTTKHGLCPKLPNDATKALDGSGAWSVFLASGGALGTPSSGTLTNCTAATPAVDDNSTKLATTAFACLQDKLGNASISASPGNITNTEVLIVKTPALAANRLAVGTVIRISLRGTFASSADGTCTFYVKLGTNGTTADSAIATYAAGTKNSSTVYYEYDVEIMLTVTATGASGTAVARCSVLNTGQTVGINAVPVRLGTMTMAAFNTTTANNILSVTAKNSAATATLTVSQALIEIAHK